MHNYLFRNYVDWHAHVFKRRQWSIEVEILYVGCREGCVGRGDGAVEERFDSGQIRCWGALVTFLTIALVTTKLNAPKGDGLLGVEIDDKRAGTLSLRKPGAFVATIGTAVLDENRLVSICDATLGDMLVVSIEY